MESKIHGCPQTALGFAKRDEDANTCITSMKAQGDRKVPDTEKKAGAARLYG